jgi:hypothetical protein
MVPIAMVTYIKEGKWKTLANINFWENNGNVKPIR